MVFFLVLCVVVDKYNNTEKRFLLTILTLSI